MSRITNPGGEPTVTCGFFNSVNDRKYDSVQLASIFDGVITDGVYASVGGSLMVAATNTNTVHVKTGRAWFDHTWTLNDGVLPIDCGNSEVVEDRIDAIVIEINRTDAVRDNFIKLVKGTPSTPAARPVMIKTNDIKQYPLCYITRKAGSSLITQLDITNTVGTSETPFVTAPLQRATVDDLLVQWRNEFNVWMSGLQTSLSGDVALNLQNQINNINNNPTVRNMSSAEYKGSAITDWDVVIENGAYMAAQAANAPEGNQDWFHVEVFRHNELYCVQVAHFFHDATKMYKRIKAGGQWLPWVPVGKSDITRQEYDTLYQSVESLKSSVASGKQSVANAINDKLGTQLSNQNTYAELAANIGLLTNGGGFDFTYGDQSMLGRNDYGTASVAGRVFMIIVEGDVTDDIEISCDKDCRYWDLSGHDITPPELLAGNYIYKWDGRYIFIANEYCRLKAWKDSDNTAVVHVIAVAK